MKFRGFLLSIVVILAMAGVIGANDSDGGVIELYDCGVLDVPNGYYVLMNDITTSGTCFEIKADGITLDLNSRRITGNEKGEGIVIRDFGSATIMNGQIYSFSEGISLQNSNNDKILANLIANNDDIGIYLDDSSNNLIKDNFVQSNQEAGIFIDDGFGNNISDSFVINGDDTGIYLDGTFDTLIKNTIIQNNLIDFHIDAYSDDECENTLVDVIGSDNKPIYYFNEKVDVKDLEASEVILCNADNSVLEDISVIQKTRKNNGIYIHRTENSHLSKVRVEKTFDGIFIEDSHKNVLTKMHLISNYGGGITIYDSTNNIIKDSYIIDTVKGGIILDESHSNKFYNNFFNNSNNFFAYNKYPNAWNVSQKNGPNIIKGPFIGGNFWGNPKGTGYSQICKDSNDDGFCDEPLILGENNVDYLPLSLPEPRLFNFSNSALKMTDVSVSITINPSKPKLGENVMALITIENLGNFPTNVSLTSGITWPPGSGGPGGGGGGSCNYCISLNPGEKHYTIQNIATPNPGKYTVSASIDSYILDPNQKNNKAFLEFVV